MKPFLHKLSGELLEKFGGNISRICVIFPSRRAGLFFKKFLSRDITRPLWLPEILSIEDFITKYSPYHIADKLTLVFELFEVYKQHGEDESFERFYPWGEMLLDDFDDIDKNLADVDYLFRILKEHKEVEEDFELKVGDIEEFHRFWESFSRKDITGIQREFINTWEIIGSVYHSYKKALLSRNIGYEGMAYRRLYEMIRTGELSLAFEKIIFAGFNFLNKCEDGMFKELLKQGKASTYWDSDKYYLDDVHQEAGHFLRKNFVELSSKAQSISWIEDHLSVSPKNIKVIGAPLQITQVKVLGNELKKMSKEELDRTAVVLPDESLLVPLLYSLPEDIESVNVTMGFPFKNSSLYGLIQLLRSLQRNKKGSGISAVFYHKDIIGILMHPYVKITSPIENAGLTESIRKKNNIYVSSKRIADAYKKAPELVSVIFNSADTIEDSLTYIFRIIQLISVELEEGAKNSVFEMEFLYKCYTELNHLSDIIARYSAEVETDTFWKLLVEILNSIKIPFSGEPLKGLQIMGLLETRLLDFDNVFILSLNEGILPRGSTQSSFIPYHLRKAFRLPCYEEEDANTAYNFYRLLQRSTNICLIYNTEAGELSSGEKSCFIMQIENELAAVNNKINLDSSILQADIVIPKRKEIIIEKSIDIVDSLRSEERFSASTLTTYLHCPLQFYFQKIAKLKEEENVEEYFTGGGFGTILHQIMDILYRDQTGLSVDEAVIFSLKKRLNEDYGGLWLQACEELPEYEEFKTGLAGKNLLFKGIIRKLAENILDNDIKESPFTIIKLETSLVKEIEIEPDGKPIKVKLFGRLDRVEEKNGIVRIIDYKTGMIKKAGQLSKESDEDHIKKIFEDSAYKENFQQLFYASLYMDTEGAEKLVIGIYPLREPSSGIYWFENEPISKEKKALFERELNVMLNKIFDSINPFKQTEDLEKCKYCPYKSICYRD